MGEPLAEEYIHTEFDGPNLLTSEGLWPQYLSIAGRQELLSPAFPLSLY